MADFNGKIIEEFRANDGRVGGPFEGAPLLLLHSTGARSGQSRVHPVMYQRLDDHSVAIFATYAGGPENPAWYHNLRSHPEADVEIGAATKHVRARVADNAERDRIWTKQKTDYPNFAGYERNTTRRIPVVVLDELQ